MKNNSTEIVVLKESEEFSCLGSSCEETCCVGWSVPVDAKTLELWNKKPRLSPYAKKLRVLPPSSASSCKVATLPHNPTTHRCNFLTSDNLCSIQNEHGHDALSHICRTYPRERKQVHNLLEESMSLACPEAARILLQEHEGLQLEIKQTHLDKDIFINQSLEENGVWRMTTVEYAWAIRSRAFAISQESELDILEKLTSLFILAQGRYHGISSTELINKAEQCKNAFLSIIDSKEIFQTMIDLISRYCHKGHKASQTLEAITYTANQRNIHSIKPFTGGNHLFDFDKTEQQIASNYLFVMIFSNAFPIGAADAAAQIVEWGIQLLWAKAVGRHQSSKLHPLACGIQRNARWLSHSELAIERLHDDIEALIRARQLEEPENNKKFNFK